MQTQSTRAATHDRHLALEREERRKIVQMRFRHFRKIALAAESLDQFYGVPKWGYLRFARRC